MNWVVEVFLSMIKQTGFLYKETSPSSTVANIHINTNT